MATAFGVNFTVTTNKEDGKATKKSVRIILSRG